MAKKKASKQTATAAAVQDKKPGRPVGAPNKEYDVVDAQATSCKRCQSTNRKPYRGKPRQLIQQFTDKIVKMVWRRTACLDCGKPRMDKFTETKLREEKGGRLHR